MEHGQNTSNQWTLCEQNHGQLNKQDDHSPGIVNSLTFIHYCQCYQYVKNVNANTLTVN